MKTSIIILTRNKLELTKLCVDSIRRHTPEPYEIIIVDNGSTDDTVDYLRKQQDIKAIFNDENVGFAKGCNLGAAIATGDNFLFLNNDTIVTDNWLHNMLNVLYSNDLIGMVGPVSNSCSGRQQIHVGYTELSGLDDFVRMHCQKFAGVVHYSTRLVGFCLLIKKEVWDEVGEFDERFGIGNFEDDDLCLRVLEAGYMSMIVMDSFVHHFGSATFNTLDVNYSQLLNQNRKKATEKWGTDIHSLLNKPPITISLCLVVQDDETTVKNCLESFIGIVDEIIIVDIGSSDQTREIASQFTARVFSKEWQHDFSEVRNFAFSQATKDYILWLDPDDVLSLENRKELFKLKRKLTKDYDAISMIYKVHFDKIKKPSYSLRRPNLVKRDKQFHWVGNTNEYLPVQGNILYSDIEITTS